MADSPSHQASTTVKSPLKRPLFTKPTWAQQDNSGSSNDFFRRSDQSYLITAAQAERKRQRKMARKQREQARDHTSAKCTHKRPRVSSDSESADDSDCSESHDGSRSHSATKRLTSPAPMTQLAELKRSPTPSQLITSPKSLSRRYESATIATKTDGNPNSLFSNVIDLEDSDDSPEVRQDDIVEVMATKRSEPVPDEDEFSPSDDEYADLARKAREKARRKRLEADVPRPASQNDRFISSGPMQQSTAPAAPDPVVSILITSRIPNTQPLIVNRKVSQRLKDVRLTWCHRQGFALDKTEAVILTWRGNRLFDVTTCRSLGIGVDSQGNIVTKGQKDILGEEERQIHMEAMTKEILEEYQRAKRQEAEGADQDETEAHKEHAPVAGKKEPPVRIILKAKGFDDFKLIVQPVSHFISLGVHGKSFAHRLHSQTTPISRIVKAFELDKKIDECREVFLSFDGDRLAPGTRVADTELSDMDYVDVYVK
ncbi:MAG: hypothetical protein Q9171_000825 [Xanthocarpia ochracea]